LESRTAISGEIPRFPIHEFGQRRARDAERRAAASLMVRPSGSMHWRSTKPPGCGGFFIAIVQPPSMVIDIINVQGFAVVKRKTTRQLARTVTAQNPLNSPLEWMQPEPRQIQIRNIARGIQAGENVAQLFCVFANHSARVVRFIKAFQSFVANRPDHTQA